MNGQHLIALLTAAFVLHACGTDLEDGNQESVNDAARLAAPIIAGEDDRWDSLMSLLTGEWEEVRANGTVFHEQWRRTDEAFLSGTGAVTVGPDTVSIEHLAIHWGDTGTYYSARVPSQNQGEFVHFRHLPGAADSLVFANPEHDFPKRIVYIRTNDGWRVTLTGIEKEVPRTLQFRFAARQTETVS